MDITPRLSVDALVIRNYGPAGFTIAETLYAGAVLVTADGVTELPGLANLDALDVTAVLPLLTAAKSELLLTGSGNQMQFIPEALKAALRAQGISSEAMDTGAACRTYNVLFTEGRHVAALLLPVA